jgi:DNA topoisomerase-1
LKKTDDPTTITESRAIELILEKRDKDNNKLVKEFSENKDVKVLRGRWGIYISIGKNNYKIPKGKVPEDLTLADCLKIAEEQDKTQTVKPKRKAKK